MSQSTLFLSLSWLYHSIHLIIFREFQQIIFTVENLIVRTLPIKIMVVY